ncbi:MAG: ArgK/MeaB family GTPase [Alphaproteobacteria bacterium]
MAETQIQASMIAALPRFAELASALGSARGKPLLARALAAIEAQPDDPATLKLLDEAYAAPASESSHVVGITGPPGVGKSSLLGALIKDWRGQGSSVGVIAVDPSSKRSGGALLGDRTRLNTDPSDASLFVRSMAARERLGGLAALTFPGVVLMRALFDLVIVESVGVGQSETEIADAVDSVVVCIQPGSGDSLQFMKAGIVEIPHIVAVTKADLGAMAERALADVEGAIGLASVGSWPVKILKLSASRHEGVGDLIAALQRHRQHLVLRGEFAAARTRQARQWALDEIRARYGTTGIARLGKLETAAGRSPFQVLAAALARLEAR